MWLSWQPKAHIDLSRHKISHAFKIWLFGLFTLEWPAFITEKTIFDLLCMLDSGERSLGDLFKLSCVKLRSHEQICLICNKVIWQWKHWQRWQFTRTRICNWQFTRIRICNKHVFAQVIFGVFLSFLCTR